MKKNFMSKRSRQEVKKTSVRLVFEWLKQDGRHSPSKTGLKKCPKMTIRNPDRLKCPKFGRSL
jgi:hypothetical protein